MSLGRILTKILCFLWVFSSVLFNILGSWVNISGSFLLSLLPSLSGALQLVSMHDQLQTRRALLLCGWTDREYAVGNGSC